MGEDVKTLPDDVVAQIEVVKGLWIKNDQARFELGKQLEELHKRCARHGTGCFDEAVAQLGRSKTTAWRIRIEYRVAVGIDPPDTETEIVSNETIQPKPKAKSHRKAQPEANTWAMGAWKFESAVELEKFKRAVTGLGVEEAQREMVQAVLAKYAAKQKAGAACAA